MIESFDELLRLELEDPKVVHLGLGLEVQGVPFGLKVLKLRLELDFPDILLGLSIPKKVLRV